MSKEVNKDPQNLETPNRSLQNNERDKFSLRGITQGIIGLMKNTKENIKEWIDDITGESDRRKMAKTLGLDEEEASWGEIEKALDDKIREWFGPGYFKKNSNALDEEKK